MSRLVLASASVARRRMLVAAGLDITIDPADLDEAAIKRACRGAGLSTIECAGRLARLKALLVSARHPSALVIGADQMLVLGETWFSKPASRIEAGDQLRRLQGRTHGLVSAVSAVLDRRHIWCWTDAAALTMRALDDAEIERYLERAGDAVLGSVGAYALEGLGVTLFERVEGDFFTILGLPLIPLLDFLRKQGVGVP